MKNAINDCSYRYIILTLTLILNISISAETVKVGAYQFPPFFEKSDSDCSGIIVDMVNEMNKIQDKYIFELFETSSKRRFMDLDSDNFDIIMFEDISWGWVSKNVLTSNIFFEDREVYITRNDPSKDQSYFDNIENKSISIILGYHYGFAGMNSDENYLNNNFHIHFSRTNDRNMRIVLEGISDISIVSLSFLRSYFVKNPEVENYLLISDIYDQQYNHTILVGENSVITVNEINIILTEMDYAGIISSILEKYGIIRE